jgi:mycoredoxin-dependent peroxiredoxin
VSVPAVGDLAPDFTTRNQHGETVTLADLRGAPAVIVFYPWAFSGICTGELCTLRDNLADFTGVGARVVAISCDAMFSLRVFADTEGFDFELLTDHWPHGAIARAYGIFDETAGCSLRGSFVLDADGRITWSVVNGIGEARDIADHLSALRAA